ncbi:MAG: bifunctional 5,10-methylenetetrahydrofolate dehydrogenase/5,10-methenyltetrahydrofolate cyclohydrolase [Thermoplasmata archaeon]|nr:bifunctional 5,10-methylenetetrahydrofolate dehydrogenase/5,10-methenyltetrahydrofolate cyclohydrolase [Thermoplasmata archaeon]
MTSTRSLDGRPVAQALLSDARKRSDEGARLGRRRPSLVSVHRAVASPFAFYLRRQAHNAEQAGVTFHDEPLADGASASTVRHRLGSLNADGSVDAVLLEHPLPEALDFRAAVRALRPEKDVDGVSTENLGHLVQGAPVQAPAVALGALAMIHFHQVPIVGRRVAVIGRSDTVGLPLALLLLARNEGANATVTVVHSRSGGLAKALASAEVVVSCVGHPGLLTRAVVPEGAAVIDVGLSSVPDPSRPGGQRAAGDADATSLEGWASALTPVPGGTGPVTVAQLMANTVHAWELLGRGEPS